MSPNTTVVTFTLKGTWEKAAYKLSPRDREITFQQLCKKQDFKTVWPMPDDLDYDQNGDIALSKTLEISGYKIDLEFRYKASTDQYSISTRHIHTRSHPLPNDVIKPQLEEIFKGLFTVELYYRQLFYTPPN